MILHNPSPKPPQRESDTKQRLRPESIDRLLELAHAMSGQDFCRARRNRSIPIGTLVYLLEVLVGTAPLPTREDDEARLDLLLSEMEHRGNPSVAYLRAALRERRLQPDHAGAS